MASVRPSIDRTTAEERSAPKRPRSSSVPTAASPAARDRRPPRADRAHGGALRGGARRVPPRRQRPRRRVARARDRRGPRCSGARPSDRRRAHRAGHQHRGEGLTVAASRGRRRGRPPDATGTCAPGARWRARATTSPPTARERFVAAVEAAGGAAKAARLLGCTRAYCDMLRTGARERPGMRVAFEIQRRMGIAMEAWMEEGTRGELLSHDPRAGG